MSEEPNSQQRQDRGLVINAGPVVIDVPRTVGYFGAIAVATAAGLLDPPLAVFIAAIPAVKMLQTAGLPQPLRFVGQIFDGAAQPVGGDAEGTVRLQQSAANHIDERAHRTSTRR